MLKGNTVFYATSANDVLLVIFCLILLLLAMHFCYAVEYADERITAAMRRHRERTFRSTGGSSNGYARFE